MREIPIDLEIDALDEGGFVATSPDVPGLVAQGATLQETVDIARALVAELAAAYTEFGGPIPAALQHIVEQPAHLQLRVPVMVP